jgi:mono/diheme cytochrome c family protein
MDRDRSEIVSRHLKRVAALVVAAVNLCSAIGMRAQTATPAQLTPSSQEADTGRALYESACAACHGIDGRGAPPAMLGFDVPVPDFTNCSFCQP